MRWTELQDDTICITKDEVEWTNTELKNSLRSIEWDLEDLEDTIDIVEKNPTKFKIDNKEITTRKHFIDTTREEVKVFHIRKRSPAFNNVSYFAFYVLVDER